MPDYRLFQGDCLEILKTLEDNSIDSVVSDPPAGIGFMNREWDTNKGGRDEWIKWMTSIMKEVYRVIKPGGHLLIWAIPRTSHWTATAIENAGFEVRDIVHHLFGSGMPHGKDISQGIDDELKVERKVIGKRVINTTKEEHPLWGAADRSGGKGMGFRSGEVDITEPGSEESKKWEGWNTQLKPGAEHWILARKPISEINISKNILVWGVGGINIDSSRVINTDYVSANKNPNQASGRYPANVMLTHCETCKFIGIDTVKGAKYKENRRPIVNRTVYTYKGSSGKGGYADENGDEAIEVWECDDNCPIKSIETNNYVEEEEVSGDTQSGSIKLGGRSKYFKKFIYAKKASTKDRNSGGIVRNIHPTVKSSDLMDYLVTMITPKNGLILDMFMGSGSTGLAALRKGFNFIGIELSPEYYEIAKARIEEI